MPICRKHTSRVHTSQSSTLAIMYHTFPASTEDSHDIIRKSRMTTLSNLMWDVFLPSYHDIYRSIRSLFFGHFFYFFSTWEETRWLSHALTDLIIKIFLFFFIQNTSIVLRKIGEIIFQFDSLSIEGVKKKLFTTFNNSGTIS